MGGRDCPLQGTPTETEIKCSAPSLEPGSAYAVMVFVQANNWQVREMPADNTISISYGGATLSSVVPNMGLGTDSTRLDIAGDNLSPANIAVKIAAGGAAVDCPVIAGTATVSKVSCDAPPALPGSYQVHVVSNGRASNTLTITRGPPSTTSVTPTTGLSAAGGAL